MSETPSGPNLKFLCDPSLGRLAKWLRIMGFDTEYMHHWDRDIQHEALKAGRIVFTRSRAAAQKRNHIHIVSDHVREQLAQVDSVFDLEKNARWFTRCNVCNETLICAKPDDVKDFVPEYVYATQKEFARCPRCSRIYWKGTHPFRSVETIKSIITSREES